MKILVQTYDTAFQNQAGGVHTRIVNTVSALRKRGVEVDFFDKFHTNVADYDILHIFKLDISNLGLIKYAKDKGIKVVLSSIVTVEKGWVIESYWKLKKLPLMTTYKLLFQELHLVDAIIAETPKEQEFLIKHYHVLPDKVAVIPDGADDIMTESKIIFDAIGKMCDYALAVARFDNNKNQRNVIRALKNTNIEMVFIGGADFISPEYYATCIEEAKEANNIHFLGWVDSNSELLKSAYCNAKVIVSASFHETFGLSIVEGIMAGAIPVVSKGLPILEYEIFEGCITCDPNNVEDIKEKITIAMKARTEEGTRLRMQDFFSWESVADQHIELYSRC